MNHANIFKKNWTLLVLISLGLFLSIGKFDWTMNINSSKNSYVLSAFLFILTISMVYFGLKIFFSKKLAIISSSITTLILNIPIIILGLDRFRYFENRPVYYCDRINKVIGCETQREHGTLLERVDISWLPNFNKMFPNEILFFSIILILGIFLINKYILNINHKKPYIIFFSLIVVQTFLHNSLWSPITYITYFFGEDQIVRDSYTWFGFLFPNGSGAVNADYISVHHLQLFFNGEEYQASQSVRRSFLIYIASQFTYFINPKYIYILLNISAWFLSAMCMFILFKKLVSLEFAFISSFLLATGTGFIFVVGQPAPHTLGYGLYIIIPLIIEKIFVENNENKIDHLVFVITLLTLSLLVYDILTILIGTVVYCYLRNGNCENLILSIITSYIMFMLYQYVAFDILKLPNYENTANIELAVKNLLNYYFNFEFSYFYFNLIWTFTYIFNDIAILFFIFIPILMLFGFVQFIPNNWKEAFVPISFGLPAIIIIIFFTMGRSGLELMPRFIYGIYPMVYFFVAVAVLNFSGFFRSKLKKVFVITVLILNFCINNFDILGYPSMYYHFYYGSGNFIQQNILNNQ